MNDPIDAQDLSIVSYFKTFISYSFTSENSAYRNFLEANSFAAPNGPLLASSKSCKSCSRRCLEIIQSHLNWPNADATTKSSELFDTVAKVETTKLKGTLWGNVGRLWPSYWRSRKIRAQKATRLKKMTSSSPIHQLTNQLLLTRVQIFTWSLSCEIDLLKLSVSTIEFDDTELLSEGYSKSSILLSIRASVLGCAWGVRTSTSSWLLWSDMTI